MTWAKNREQDDQLNQSHQSGAHTEVSRHADSFSFVPPCPPQPVSALAMLRKHRKRPRLCLMRSLDIPCDVRASLELHLGITEIAGVAGSGKTQMALGLCVACASSLYNQYQNNPISNSNSATISGIKRTRRLSEVQTQVPNPYKKAPPVNVLKSNTNASANVNAVVNTSTSTNPHVCTYHKALYISMGEGSTQTQIAHRLQQISQQRQKEGTIPPNNNNNNNNNSILSRILTRFVRNQDDFQALVQNELPNMLFKARQNGNPIGLVVFDSIAGLFRVSEETNPQLNSFFMQRSGILFNSAGKMKELSDTFHVPMVVINQVTSSTFSKNSTGHGLMQDTPAVPALGITWSNCVNTSYLLSRTETEIALSNSTMSASSPHESRVPSMQRSTSAKALQQQTKFLRHLNVQLSPSFPQSPFAFKIDSGGAIAVATDSESASTAL